MSLRQLTVVACIWVYACTNSADAPPTAAAHSLAELQRHSDFAIWGAVESLAGSSIGIRLHEVLWQRDPQQTIADTLAFESDAGSQAAPAFRKGAQIIVFLEEYKRGAYRMIGGSAGRFDVADGHVTVVVEDGVQLEPDTDIREFHALLGAPANLPAGWEAAQPIADFAQAQCDLSASDVNLKDSLHADLDGESLVLAYEHAQFRCMQELEGFVKHSDQKLEVLVQPIFMQPRFVAKCACRYDITMQLAAEPGSWDLTLFRRWDSIGGSHDPEEVGSAHVAVP